MRPISHFRHRDNTSLEHNLSGGFNVGRFSNVAGLLVNFQSQLITIAVIFCGAQAVFAQKKTIRQLIAFKVQQTSFLFNMSVLENIHLGRLDSNFEDIQKAWTGYQPCWVSPDRPDYQQFPKFREARRPGELLVQPADRYHEASCLDKPNGPRAYPAGLT